MRKSIILSAAAALVATAGLVTTKALTPKQQLSYLELASIEALVDPESGEATITCDYPRMGRCWKIVPLKPQASGSTILYTCVFSGMENDFCTM